jgi:RHS repeat-associated protein
VLQTEHLPEVLPLAACPQLAGNSRLGFGASTHTLHQGFGFVISSTALGMSAPLYDSRVRSRYTGKERDAESGLDYFGARYYGSNMGRFMSPDDFGGHLEDPQTLNRYAYVRNNPLRYTDPTGHDLKESCTQTEVNKSTCGGHGRNKHVGTTDGKGHFHVTHFQTDKNGNLPGHSVNFNTNGIHIDGNKAEFIAGTDPTRINGEAGTGWAGTHFVANSNCGGTCEAGGALFGNFDLRSGLGIWRGQICTLALCPAGGQTQCISTLAIRMAAFRAGWIMRLVG